MLLVTGGTGFIGLHTVEAILDRGETALLVQRSARELPGELAAEDVSVEQVDVTDLDSLTALGDTYDITGIVHLAGSMPWKNSDDGGPVESARRSLGGLFNIVEAGRRWGVRRIGVASTIGVYGGLPDEGGLREDHPLPMTARHLIPTFKKVGELLNGHLADATGIEIINYRISGTWGPRGHDDPFFPAPELVHAAAEGRPVDLSKYERTPHAEDALDLCYVKDTGRAIALLHTAEQLNHATYNVASGRATSNAEVSTAIRTVVPDAQLDLPEGGSSARTWLDITRLREDTGYEPEWDLERSAADYVAWLQAGNER